MRQTTLSLVVLLFTFSLASAENALVSVKSAHGVPETADRLEAMLKEKGMKVFIRVDHAAGANKVDKTLRPTELLIFGNPKVGTPLMECGQTIGIDLPQKALIWEDEAGEVWVSYNDPAYLAKRHDLKGCDEVLEKVAKALANFTNAATQP
jgi:uncharacterized protein (DUF302 family)